MPWCSCSNVLLMCKDIDPSYSILNICATGIPYDMVKTLVWTYYTMSYGSCSNVLLPCKDVDPSCIILHILKILVIIYHMSTWLWHSLWYIVWMDVYPSHNAGHMVYNVNGCRSFLYCRYIYHACTKLWYCFVWICLNKSLNNIFNVKYFCMLLWIEKNYSLYYLILAVIGWLLYVTPLEHFELV